MSRTSTRYLPRVFSLVALAVAAVLLVAATSACAPSLPTDPPGITGTVTSLVPGDERPASMLVEGPTPEPGGAGVLEANVTIEPSTQFFGPDGKKGVASAIVKGSHVRVWFQGAVAESYPVQGSAKAVQLLVK